MTTFLRSPTNGRPLEPAGDDLLTDGDTLWPCLDGIPYLRVGRDALRGAAVEAIRAGDRVEALALLLADRRHDGIPPAAHADALTVARGVGSAARAMDLLSYGGMSWYALHRWCQPTFLSGLALLESHADAGGVLMEVGCGTGQFLWSWSRSAPHSTVIGGDIVFSHLWIAHRFAIPHANLLCFDVEARFPLATGVADTVFAHDAFHYFTDKSHVLSELRRVGRRTLLGHVHNAAYPNLSAGTPLDVDSYLDLTRPDAVFDDDALTWTALGREPAPAASIAALRRSAACALAMGDPPRTTAHVTLPPAGTPLRLNPLLATGEPVWPSEKFADEFVGDWRYLSEMTAPDAAVLRRAEAGATGSDPEVDDLARRRVVLDLPERWL